MNEADPRAKLEPFRALIGTMRSLHDPTLLIQTSLPDLIRGAPAPTPVCPV